MINFLIGGVVICGLIVAWHFLGRQILSPGSKIRDYNSLYGTARLLVIMKDLRQLNKLRRQDLLEQFWQKAELPLLEVLPDNTAETRIELTELLNQAHAYTKNRELAHAIMNMRNSVLERNG